MPLEPKALIETEGEELEELRRVEASPRDEVNAVRVRVESEDPFARDLDAIGLPLAAVPKQPAPGPVAPRPVSTVEALTFAFTPERWGLRVVLASVWLVIPVLGPLAVRGWASEAHVRLARHHPDPLPVPRWRDLLHYARRGTPSGLVSLASASALLTTLAFAFFVLNAGLWASVLAGGPLAIGLLVGGALASVTLASLVAIVSNAVLIRAELGRSLAVALASGQVWPLARRGVARVLWSLLLFTLLAAVCLGLGSTLLCVGALPAWVVVEVGASHLRHQLYQRQRRLGAPAIELPDAELLPSERHLLAVGRLEERAR